MDCHLKLIIFSYGEISRRLSLCGTPLFGESFSYITRHAGGHKTPKHQAVFCNAASTRLAVKGPSYKRTPVASKIALPIDAATGIVAGSPAPSGAMSGRLIKTTSNGGRSVKRKIG